MKQALLPVINAQSKILILGTLPGDQSLRLGQYYANPRNQFWTILSRVYQEPIGENYSDKLLFLDQKRLALWDVLKAADREGSSDSNITTAVPNDFSFLLETYQALRAVVFNGDKSHKIFFDQILNKQLSNPYNLRFLALPSTSPARPLSLEAKIAQWKVLTTL